MTRLVLVVSLALSTRALAQDVPAETPPTEPTAPTTEAAEPEGEGTLDPETEARALFDRAMSLASEERWGEAVEFFRRAAALVTRPSIDYNLGISLFTLGRHVEAIEALERFLAASDPSLDDADRTHASAMLLEAHAAVGRLALRVTPPTAEVSIDGTPTGPGGELRDLVLDPGRHVLEVTAEGHLPSRIELALLPGSRAESSVELSRRPPRLRVDVGRLEAEVRVDEELVAIGAADVELTPGTHTVRITAVGHVSEEHEVTARAGEVVALTVELVAVPPETPIHESPLFWGLLGGGIVAIAVGIGVGVAVNQPAPPYGGSLGVVVETLRF